MKCNSMILAASLTLLSMVSLPKAQATGPAAGSAGLISEVSGLIGLYEKALNLIRNESCAGLRETATVITQTTEMLNKQRLVLPIELEKMSPAQKNAMITSYKKIAEQTRKANVEANNKRGMCSSDSKRIDQQAYLAREALLDNAEILGFPPGQW